MPGMSNPYLGFVESLATAHQGATKLPRGGLSGSPQAVAGAEAPVAVILAPHPDDECIVGGLALRLRREAGVRVVNVAVTLGSNQARRAERRSELAGACRYLDFECEDVDTAGLERITATARTSDPVHWNACVDKLATVLSRLRPSIVFVPHSKDWNGTHIGTHHLGLDALARLPGLMTTVVETEFWGAMDDPNLMVESSTSDVADLCAALSFHVGEIARNPYHVRLPAWLLDNVRRGGELVGGQGNAAPAFTFATLYRVSLYRDGALHPHPKAPRTLSQSTPPTSLLP